MKYSNSVLWVVAGAIFGGIAWLFTASFVIGLAVFAVPVIASVYIPYAHDNPKHVWFKRKLYGWGWTPVTLEGWIATLVYVGLILLFASTLDEQSTNSEIAFTFGLPAVLLTIAFIRLAYLKGEKPRWQWGERNETSGVKKR